MYKLRSWIDINKIDWNGLCKNPNAIDLLEKNHDKIHWSLLSENPNAISILSKNKDKINRYSLSKNPIAIHILSKINVDWSALSFNLTAMYLLSSNPSIFELDYEALEKRCNIYKEELIKKALHPYFIKRYLNHPDLKDKDLEYILDNCF